MLEDDNFVDASIYLAPPGNGMESDEDSDTEEGFSANHLSCGQLRASAEFVINYGNDKVNSLDDDVSDNIASDEGPDIMDMNMKQIASQVGNRLFTHCPLTFQAQWISADLNDTISQLHVNSLNHKHQWLYLTLFFSDYVIEYTVRMTNMYAQHDNSKHGFFN